MVPSPVLARRFVCPFADAVASCVAWAALTVAIAQATVVVFPGQADNPWGVLAFAALHAPLAALFLMCAVEALTGVSPGRFLMGLVVTSTDGTRPGWRQRIGRACAKYVFVGALLVVGGWVARLLAPGEESELVIAAPLLLYGIANSVRCACAGDRRSVVDVIAGTRTVRASA